MLKRNLWKLLLSITIMAWAVSSLLPLKDEEFSDYAKSAATAKTAEFASLVDEASAMHASGEVTSAFIALKQISKQRKIDLASYFPEMRFEASLTNIDKRNKILLTELLSQSKSPLQFGLDLRGGIAITLEVDEGSAEVDNQYERREKLDKAIEIIGDRVNSFGVTEPVIRPVGDNRIEVQLPGLDPKENPEVVENVKKPARLDFRIVHPTLSPRSYNGVPPGYEILILEDDSRRDAVVEELFVKIIPEMSGDSIENSFARPDIYGKPEVILQFTTLGSEQFANITREIAETGQQTGQPGRMAVVLDGKLYSAPTVREEINSDSAVITGTFSEREARNLSDVLNNPLDLPLIIREQYEVGPSLAADAISSGVRASVIGTVLVGAFMITYYTVGGIVAVITLAVNLLLILGVMSSIGATLTLPGLAGIILTVGMAVDANILIFERMREELALGKSLKASVSAGYDKAFTTIIDAHLTQLAICAVMIGLGTGPIKGFGVTLAIGVFSTMFSVLITGHFITDLLVDKGIVKKFRMMSFIKAPKIDFLKYARPAFIVSWLIVLLGVGTVFMKGDKIYGIDFAGGDSITLAFQERIEASEIRTVAENNDLGEVNSTYIEELGTDSITLRIETAYDKSAATLAALQKAHPEAGLEKIGENRIGPSIGEEIQLNALLALSCSMVIVLLYVAIRFEFGFGIGAVVASVHDILMTIGLFVIVGHQFSSPMVAAILCIAGYSINDTIVVFDRIREELKINPNTRLRDVVNLAIHRVFARSLMTSITTLLAAFSLYLFGTGVLKELSFTFIVGIVTGTFSSIFIASPVFFWWHKGDRKHVEAHADVAPKYEWTGSSKASE